jgi:hypothetical protein
MSIIQNPIDETELRMEARRLYRELGSEGLYRVIYQLIVACNIMLDIIKEERIFKK